MLNISGAKRPALGSLKSRSLKYQMTEIQPQPTFALTKVRSKTMLSSVTTDLRLVDDKALPEFGTSLFRDVGKLSILP